MALARSFSEEDGGVIVVRVPLMFSVKVAEELSP